MKVEHGIEFKKNTDKNDGLLVCLHPDGLFFYRRC